MATVLDTDTGTLYLFGGRSIGSKLRKSDFLSSSLGTASEVFINNDPWISYKVKVKLPDAVDFIVVLYFHGEALFQVTLFHELEDDDESNWCEEQELKRKSWHEGWLRSHKLAVEQYKWGQLRSYYDAKSCCSDIHIIYQADRKI